MPEEGRVRAGAIVVADIGGTNVRLALARGTEIIGDPLRVSRESVPDLQSACRRFLARVAQPVRGAAIAIAGPVEDGRVAMTNAPWEVDRAALASAIGSDAILLLNDFAAVAFALPLLRPGDTGVVAAPKAGALPRARGARATVGPGTGLGVAGLVPAESGWSVVASEGGHASFAPETEFERRVHGLAARRYGRVSWERVLSGPGLELIHDAAVAGGEAAGDEATAAEIVAAAAAANSPAAVRAVTCFAELLGAFAGDVALMFRADAGVWITGGVARHVLPLVDPQSVAVRFHDKGRFAAWLGRVPLELILAEDVAFRGAAAAFLQRFGAGD